jgi:hypothetical protein
MATGARGGGRSEISWFSRGSALGIFRELVCALLGIRGRMGRPESSYWCCTSTSQIVKSSILHVTRIYSMYSMNIYKGITGFNYIYVAYRTD